MKTKELRDKETNVLQDEVATKRRHLFDLRTQAVTEKLEDPSQVGKTRREIAQILTLLRQRELDQKKQQATTAAGK
jgi:large subunit ribosomal protein L29